MISLFELFQNRSIGPFILASNEEPIWTSLNLLESFVMELSEKIESDVDHVSIKNRESVVIGKGCTFGPFVAIEGPVYIGDGCDIRSCAYIRPGSVIGNSVTIGHGTEIVRSIISDKASLPHFNYVGDSILGEGVNLGAGVKCANFRLDGGAINVQLDGNRVSSGRRKLGSLIGDGASIGCNAVLNPGTVILPKGVVFPGSVI